MKLLTRIQRHLNRSGMKPSRFGRLVLNDPHFVWEMRNGRQPGPNVILRVTAWLDEQEETRR
jgi:hypothetical protein